MRISPHRHQFKLSLELLTIAWPHMQDEAAIAEANRKASSLGFLAADWAFCAATFILSDILYLGGASSLQLTAVLGAIAALNWKLFDGTKPGQHCCPCWPVLPMSWPPLQLH